jgi:hypothetical protein
MKLTYSELKTAIGTETWFGRPPADWFKFLEERGWTGAEFREANDSRQKARGKQPLPPCALCERHHDTLADADRCAQLPTEEPAHG